MTGSQKSTLNQIWFGYQSLSFTTSKETSNLSQMNKEVNKLKGYYDKTETLVITVIVIVFTTDVF